MVNMEDLNNIKLPYIRKNVTLMSPGIWNNFYYNSNEIKKSYDNTDWKSKEVRSLFLDHIDESTREWVGEIQNPKLINDKIIGDLVVVDKSTAVKLAYGARTGVSPKVSGESEEGDNVMFNFKYDNFSIVLNPAVKTNWINNSDMTAFEKIRKEKGMSVDEFYAIPRNPPSASKLPIYDEAHLRNAISRFDQVKDASSEEVNKAKAKIKASAEKFGIKIDEEKFEKVNTMSNEENISPEVNLVEVKNVEQDFELEDYTDFVKKVKKENPEWDYAKIAEEYKKTKENSEKNEIAKEYISFIDAIIDMAEKLKKLKAGEKMQEEEEEPEKKPEEDDKEEEQKNEEQKEDEVDEEKKDEEEMKEETTENDKEIENKEEEKPKDEEKPKEDEVMEEDNKEDEEEEKKMSQTVEKMSQKYEQSLTEMQKKIQELQSQLDKPARMSQKVQSLSNKSTESKEYSNEDFAFLDELRSNTINNI